MSVYHYKFRTKPCQPIFLPQREIRYAQQLYIICFEIDICYMICLNLCIVSVVYIFSHTRETLKKENCPDNVELFLESHTERGDHAKATRAKTSLAKKEPPHNSGAALIFFMKFSSLLHP